MERIEALIAVAADNDIEIDVTGDESEIEQTLLAGGLSSDDITLLLGMGEPEEVPEVVEEIVEEEDVGHYDGSSEKVKSLDIADIEERIRGHSYYYEVTAIRSVRGYVKLDVAHGLDRSELEEMLMMLQDSQGDTRNDLGERISELAKE